MKWIKLFFISFIASMLFWSGNVLAVKNPYKKELSWGGINCTWNAWQQTYDRTGVALPGFGNAREWYNDAKNAGFAVGSEPKVNSIIVLDNYLDYGHVAFVDSVKNGSVYVWDSVKCYREMTEEEHAKWRDCIINNTTSADDEYKCDYLKVLEEAPCEYSKENGNLDKVVGYIYVTEPRKTVSQKRPSSNNTNVNTNKEEKKKPENKSSNNYLSDLKIDGLEFTFAKDVLEYNLEVPYNVSIIKMEAKPEDTKSIINMDNEYKLEVGDNTFNIKVTAEDKSIRNYSINIKRLEKEEPVKKAEPKILQEKKSFKNKDIIVSAVIVIIVGIVGIAVRIFLKK